MKLFIAAGHGGGDPGSVANNTNEAAELINIVDNAVDILQKVADADHQIVKIDDKYNLQDEVAIINDQTTERENDIAIEVHLNCNAGAPGTGTECYYGKKELAEKLQTSLVKDLGLRDRGVKDGNWLYFNNATVPQSALVELGFINNPEDLRIVRERGALALAKAIAATIGLADPSASKPPSEPTLSTIWFLSNIAKIFAYFQKNPDLVKQIEQSS